ncbi:MAG: ATP synthase F1 subunit delta [Syntrophobacteraceae bacterium]
MKNLVIAKRYAKALFHLALEGKQVEQYCQELDGFAGLLKEVPSLADAIQNRLYPEATRTSILAMVTEKAGLAPIMRSFISLLLEKGRVQNLPEVAEFYHKLMDEHANIARAKLSAASALDEGAIQDIAKTLEKMTGKKVVVEFKQDPSLIGGVVAQIGDLVLDGSVKRQLLNFKETLKRGALG